MNTIDEVLARQRWRALIPLLTDTEVSAALRMVDETCDIGTRETAVQQLVDSSDSARELVKAFADLCRLFALDSTPAKSAADIH